MKGWGKWRIKSAFFYSLVTCKPMQKYECGNCSHLFDERERICENWRETEESLICPNCKHYLVETYDDTLERRLSKWFLASFAVVCLSYLIVVVVLDATSYRNMVLIIGFLVVAPLMLGYRIVNARRFVGNIGTRSLGPSNM